MTAQVLRNRYMREFSGMKRYSIGRAWLIVAAYVAQILGGVLIGGWLLSLDLSGWTVAGLIGVILFVGTRFRGINNIVHECSHSTFTERREDNVRIGAVCASLVLRCFADYRDDHLSHHAHNGDYEHDAEFKAIENLRLHDPVTPGTILRHAINPFLGRHLPYYLGANFSGRDGQIYRLSKFGLVAATVGLVAVAPLTGLLFVVVPYVLIYSAHNYWTDCMDHAGLVEEDDELEATRNMLARAPLRLLFFPRNDCYHLVHHLFPQIPARHFHSSHMVLSEDEIYAQKQNAVRYPAANDGAESHNGEDLTTAS